MAAGNTEKTERHKVIVTQKFTYEYSYMLVNIRLQSKRVLSQSMFFDRPTHEIDENSAFHWHEERSKCSVHKMM